jgi:hypothetical protein
MKKQSKKELKVMTNADELKKEQLSKVTKVIGTFMAMLTREKVEKSSKTLALAR